MKILGINFYNGTPEGVVQLLKTGGLLTVPAAPALTAIKKDPAYYEALRTADIAIPDSGYMALIWNLTHKEKIRRISGLEFINSFFADKDIREGSDIFLVNPGQKEAESNSRYLQKIGICTGSHRSYIAPVYDKTQVRDDSLLALVEEVRPKYIVINLGGGVQEKLGAYLKNNLSYKPAIICTGAAIAFLAGDQAKIPAWGDRYFLGWLLRCIHTPGIYIPRYFRAFKLIGLMLKYGENQPEVG